MFDIRYEYVVIMFDWKLTLESTAAWITPTNIRKYMRRISIFAIIIIYNLNMFLKKENTEIFLFLI